MLIQRRSLLALVAATPAATLLPGAALAQVPAAAPSGAPPGSSSADPRMSERSFGHPDAKVTVTEFFSLTCTHCADFQATSFPVISKRLIDTGQVRIVYWDFPLDQVALTAAMVARALPPERYEPFISSLFASQDRWAFGQNVNYTEQLAQMAALAGMPRKTFDATVADTGLRNAILARQQEAETKYHVDSTPTFLVNGHTHPGEMDPDTFAKFVTEAAG
jgi:protein-disulfide isomerase